MMINRFRTCLVLALWALSTPILAQSTPQPQNPADAQPPAQQFEETVEVVAPTPLPGIGIERDRIPSNIQTATAETLSRTGGSSTAEQINLSISSVHINDATTNPFQPDLQFRGFVGSPMLGLPQGLAIYQDGVRLNEPFGDTVNWDMLPGNAIAGINLMPGSNPLFGLNALGGAVSMQTKTGFSHPGHGVTVTAGSFGRQVLEAESAAHSDRLSYFVAGNLLSEDGWRDHSPSRVRQLFGDVEWRASGPTTLNASVTTGINRLIGNAPAPIQLLEEDRKAVFTFPDETSSNMTLLSLRARHVIAGGASFDGSFYYRHAAIDTFNGDDSNYDECEAQGFEKFLCSDDGEGEPVEDQFGNLIPVDENDELDATNNTSATGSNGWGVAFQTTQGRPVSGRPNHFVAGVTFDRGGSDYESATEIARLTDERGTVGTGLFDEDAAVGLETTVSHTGLYAADFLTVAPKVTLMGAARFNHSSVVLRDQLGTDLNGDHSFTRLNPAAGVTVALSSEVTAFGSFSMSSRVPAPSELSCADPADPCRLPNAFVADPPLEQVVASTWEGGIRGHRPGLNWSASVFRTANRDDIMFISSGPLTNTGHFENVGDTLRQGFEVGASGIANGVRWGAAYSFLHATFGSDLTLSSPNHPAEADGEIEVEAGDTIPSMPGHNLKANVSTTIRRLTVGGNLVGLTGQYMRGDEANLLSKIDGFAVVNLNAQFEIGRNIRVRGRVANLFGAEYETFGVLGDASEVLGDDYDDPRFLSPGAPRAAWIGLEFSFR